MDGVRLNQPFGDVVSWDLIPRLAISSTTMMPGSNPLFGLNTLGGALSLQTKDGRTQRGTSVQAIYGSDVRRAFEVEHGGSAPAGSTELAGTLFAEDGWRDDSPSDVRQIFGKVGWERRAERQPCPSARRNSLNGNGAAGTAPARARLRQRLYEAGHHRQPFDASSTSRRGAAARARARSRATPTTATSTPIRSTATSTRTRSISRSISRAPPSRRRSRRPAIPAFRPAAPTRRTRRSRSGAASPTCCSTTSRPRSATGCSTARTSQNNGGSFGQVTRRALGQRRRNQFTVGGGFDRSHAGFVQSTELGYLNPDRSVTGVGAFGDGGRRAASVDGEPFDTRVDLDGVVQTWSLYATDTLSFGAAPSVTLSGRYNRTSVGIATRSVPAAAQGSLDGDHTFQPIQSGRRRDRQPSRASTLYAGYSEGSRAATSIELGCADPEQPCKLPNAMAGDPPLEQVVTRTIEAGRAARYRGPELERRRLPRHNDDDILFVMSEQTGFGYFRNLGRRGAKGLELARPPRRPRDVRLRLHVPRGDLRERGDGQRREQQLER